MVNNEQCLWKLVTFPYHRTKKKRVESEENWHREFSINSMRVPFKVTVEDIPHTLNTMIWKTKTQPNQSFQ